MRITFSTRLILALTLATSAASGQCVANDKVWHEERFSAMKEVAGLPTPSGVQLTLREKGTRVTAILRDYEGQPGPVVTTLSGTLRNCDVDVKGTNRRGKVEIRGKITVASFECTITRHIGAGTYSEKVLLRRELPESVDTAQR